MGDKMTVLVLESDTGAADSAIEQLEGDGHSVVRCHDRNAVAFPCNALVEGRDCPLEASVVDVALVVRSSVHAEPTALEDGASCAFIHRVPVVVAGRVVLNPFQRHATTVLKDTDHVVEACRHAATAPLSAHAEVAKEHLLRVLEQHGYANAPCDVQVVRRNGSLVVEVTSRDLFDHTTKSVASARMIGAIRELDRHARGIDVGFVVES
jgi:hypothetical protein